MTKAKKPKGWSDPVVSYTCLKYEYVFLPEEDGRWTILFPYAPGCASFGNSRHEAYLAGIEAIHGWVCSHDRLPRRPMFPVCRGEGSEVLEIQGNIAVHVDDQKTLKKWFPKEKK